MIVSTWKTFGTSFGWVLMNGTHACSSRVSRGSRVMKNAPAMAPEMVPAPPMSTMAMYCTDSSRLNELGSKKPVIVACHGPEALGDEACSVEERFQLLQDAAAAGARFVDVDWSLALELDGRTVYACTARLEPRAMQVAPLSNKKLVRDLVTEIAPPAERFAVKDK